MRIASIARRGRAALMTLVLCCLAVVSPSIPAMSADAVPPVYLPIVAKPWPARLGFTRRSSDAEGRQHSNICAINTDGSGFVQLSTGAGFDLDPAWSPDGTTIAFASLRDATQLDLYVIARDGSNLRQLTTNPGSDRWPTWSPDSKSLAFASENADGKFITRIDVESGQQTVLTPGIEYSISPAWSPDGAQIAFIGADPTTGRFDIYRVHPDGSNLIQVTHSSEQHPVYGSHPTWSPDSQMLAFITNSPSHTGQLAVMNVDGTQVRLLTDQPAFFTYPAWSPNRNTIAFTSTNNGYSHLFTIDLDGTGLRQVTNEPASDQYVTWAW